MGRVRHLTATESSSSFVHKIGLLMEAITIHESVYALPFAYTGMVLAAGGLPTWQQFIWITVAMVSARTIGMSANRIIDRHIDAKNPRSSGRHLPSGKLAVADLAVPSVVALGVLLFAAARLNTLALALAPVAAAYMVIYPFTKRFTWITNLLLGWALAIAPSAAWIGVAGSLSWQPVLLSLTVALWAGSFDILYHTQDVEFHTREGLNSVARRFGIVVAFRWARSLDGLAIACLIALGLWMELAWPYHVGWVVVAGLLVRKHRLVSPTDMSRFGVAFFRINAYVSTTILLATLAALLI